MVHWRDGKAYHLLEIKGSTAAPSAFDVAGLYRGKSVDSGRQGGAASWVGERCREREVTACASDVAVMKRLRELGWKLDEKLDGELKLAGEHDEELDGELELCGKLGRELIGGADRSADGG